MFHHMTIADATKYLKMSEMEIRNRFLEGPILIKQISKNKSYIFHLYKYKHIGLLTDVNNLDVVNIKRHLKGDISVEEEKEQNKELLRIEKDRIAEKQKIKADTKALIKKKFKISDIYNIPKYDKAGNKHITKYKLIKYIYTQYNMPVNVVILKSINGKRTPGHMLSEAECRNFHIKYEPGLEVWDMSNKYIK